MNTPSTPSVWESAGYGSEHEFKQARHAQRVREQEMFNSQMKALEQQALYQEETLRRQQELADLQRQEFEAEQLRLETEEAQRLQEQEEQEKRTTRRRQIAAGGRGRTIFTSGTGDEEQAPVLKRRLGG